MTKAEAIHAFFSSYGIPAYQEHSVPVWLEPEPDEEPEETPAAEAEPETPAESEPEPSGDDQSGDEPEPAPAPSVIPAEWPPKNAPPYITYELATSDWYGEPVSVTASIWDCSESWQFVNDLADTIAASLRTFKRLQCDDGIIVVWKGTPFAQSWADGAYKRKILQLEFLFVTN